MLSGCERKVEQTLSPTPAASPAAPATAGVPAATPADDGAPAESSLSIKRGIARAAGDHSVFHTCDDKTDLWLIDEGDDTLAQMFAEGMKAAYVEVYGERAPVPDDLPAARNNAGIFVLEQLLYAGAPGEDGGCVLPPADAVVTARGNEPFWTVQITDTKAVWKQQDAAQEIVLDALQSQDAEGTVSYRASTAGSTTAAGHQLELLIDAQPCRDLVSDEYFAFAARAVLDGKEFKGCARVGK
jgi:uncharacterized membrane protein